MGHPLKLVSETMRVDASSPSEIKVISEVGLLKRHKAVGSHKLLSSLFKEGGEMLTSELTELQRSIWAREEIYKDSYKATVVLTYKKGDWSPYENHIGIRLVSFGPKHFLLHKVIYNKKSESYNQKKLWIGMRLENGRVIFNSLTVPIMAERLQVFGKTERSVPELCDAGNKGRLK